MIINSDIFERETVIEAAKKIASAGRTAPKACGLDSLEIKVVTGDDLIRLGKFTEKIGNETNTNYFIRDGRIIQNCQALVLIGLKDEILGLSNCGYCGFENCGSCMKNGGHCAIKISDLGIAVGSCCSMAADMRIDNRVLYSVGKCAIDFGIFTDKNVFNAYAIGLSISEKNVFFDREAIQEK